jgi:hypothetical protein
VAQCDRPSTTDSTPPARIAKNINMIHGEIGAKICPSLSQLAHCDAMCRVRHPEKRRGDCEFRLDDNEGRSELGDSRAEL